MVKYSGKPYTSDEYARKCYIQAQKWNLQKNVKIPLAANMHIHFLKSGFLSPDFVKTVFKDQATWQLISHAVRGLQASLALIV